MLITRLLAARAVAGGESKDDFWRVVLQCADALPPGKPRYLMGVGYALDLVVCVALGKRTRDLVGRVWVGLTAPR